jgi:Tol biopolymer transport system component/DNA-binding winged helix-turn-helix (wHTH) protein
MPFTNPQKPGFLSSRTPKVAFDHFEVDLRSGELCKNGTRVRLQAQPFQLLALLLENAGEVVSREELCAELWPGDTFVDFEHSLPAAVNKIREALGDSASEPRYIETLPKRGYRFIGKIKAEAPVVMTPAEAPPGLGVVAAPGAKRQGDWKWGLGALVALVAVALVWALVYRRSAASGASVHVPLAAVPFTAYPGLQTAPSLSPDGSRIVFAWDSAANGAPDPSGKESGRRQYDLYVKAIGSETLLRLTNHPSEWISSTWSPDGTQIAFHRLAPDDNGIYVVPALGGPERKLVTTHTPYAVAAPINWSPDGKWLAYADTENGKPGDRAFLLNMTTLEAHEFPHDPACRHEGLLTFSHSGKELLILCVISTVNFDYLVTDVEGKSRRLLARINDFPSSALWSGDDQSVIVGVNTPTGSQFMQIGVSSGQVHRLPDIGGDWPTFSRDGGKLAYSVSDSHFKICRKDLQNLKAPAVEMYPSSRPQDAAQFSPDGRHVVFDSARSGKWSVWLGDSDGGNLVQISQSESAGFPQWSPDSRKVVFESDEADGSLALYTADISDRVVRKLKIDNVRNANLPYWSHDGKWIYFLGYEKNGHQLYRCPAEGGEATLLLASLEITEPIESPDGRTLYYPSRYSDASMMMLALDHPGATAEEVPGMPKLADQSQWVVTKEGIYFTSQDRPRAVYFYDFATRQTREVFTAENDLNYGMSISPDGRYLLYSQINESSASIMLVNDFH